MKPQHFLAATAFVLSTMLCLSFAEKQPINEPLGTASPPPSSDITEVLKNE